jgi:hypothetical protein
MPRVSANELESLVETRIPVLVDGGPVGYLTDFNLSSGATGPVYTIPVLTSGSFLPGKVTLPISQVMVFDPTRPVLPPPPRNRAERRQARRKG